MCTFHHKYYYSEQQVPSGYLTLENGYQILSNHPMLSLLAGTIQPKITQQNSKGYACVTSNGHVYANFNAKLRAEEWAYTLAHCLLHLAFGHFDYDKLPSKSNYYPDLWNKACDIYVTRFLSDINFGTPTVPDPADIYSKLNLNSEIKIYEHLLELENEQPQQTFGTNSLRDCDMVGLNHPVFYKNNETNTYIERFSYAISTSINQSVSIAGGRKWSEKQDTIIKQASSYFLTHYPLLGGLAASFKIIEDIDFCHNHDIQIAAVNSEQGEIYANPSCTLSLEEWKFVLAHEYLHAGLCHHLRCQGRDPYLWNVACDYVINDWLCEMQIGKMPEYGLLYDEDLHGLSAEAIYDMIVKEFRKYSKLSTFRGYGKGDLFGNHTPCFDGIRHGMTLDDFFKNSLREGLDYHMSNQRGYLPAGLVEEIRALTMPPIPWEVSLAEWFDAQFPPLQKHRTYARPSRRQGATPDIPRASYTLREEDTVNRTFGVVLDTSGSMSSKQLGLALGAIASFAVSKDVPFVRIIFCDAQATDAGYMAPEDIAGKVEVTGRGGTVLQPGIDVLQNTKDFPSNGPILIITDGDIENKLKINREHAFLVPKGKRLPFVPKGKVFYMKNYN